MKIIVAGAGNVGKKLVEQLTNEEHNIVVVDQNADLVGNIIDTFDVNGIVGNCVSGEILKNAGVKNADLLIACSQYDEMNILCCMIAKKLGVRETIARVRNPEYFNLFKDVELGLSMLVNPEYQTALEINRILKYPYAKRIEPFAGGQVDLVEFTVAKGSPLHGVQLKDLTRQLGIRLLVCLVERNGKAHIPTGDFILQTDDSVYVTASSEDIADLFKYMGFPKRAKKVLITGGGRTSFYLAKELKRNRGTTVKIIEADEKRCQFLDESLNSVDVVCGDSTDQDLLLDEGLPNADAFVTLEESDEKNLITSVYATGLGVRKVITKVDKAGYFGMFAGRGTESIVSICNSTVNEILRYVRAQESSGAGSVKKVYRMPDNEAEMLEFSVSRGFWGVNTPIKELNFKSQILICAIVRGEEVIVPGGGDVIQVGDTVLVVTMEESLSDLNDILE